MDRRNSWKCPKFSKAGEKWASRRESNLIYNLSQFHVSHIFNTRFVVFFFRSTTYWGPTFCFEAPVARKVPLLEIRRLLCVTHKVMLPGEEGSVAWRVRRQDAQTIALRVSVSARDKKKNKTGGYWCWSFNGIIRGLALLHSVNYR